MLIALHCREQLIIVAYHTFVLEIHSPPISVTYTFGLRISVRSILHLRFRSLDLNRVVHVRGGAAFDPSTLRPVSRNVPFPPVMIYASMTLAGGRPAYNPLTTAHYVSEGIGSAASITQWTATIMQALRHAFSRTFAAASVLWDGLMLWRPELRDWHAHAAWQCGPAAL